MVESECLVCARKIKDNNSSCRFCGSPLMDKGKIERILEIQKKIKEDNFLRKRIWSIDEARKDRQERTIIGVQPDKVSGEEYGIIYINYSDFKIKERSIKKHNMLAYKKLVYEYYPSIKEGNFPGDLVYIDRVNNVWKYELVLPTDRYFSILHGDIVFYYEIYANDNLIIFNTFEPSDILIEGHQKELTTYKGVLISKSHAEKDMFKINLLNIINK